MSRWTAEQVEELANALPGGCEDQRRALRAYAADLRGRENTRDAIRIEGEIEDADLRMYRRHFGDKGREGGS